MEHALALLALWNDIAPDVDAAYNEWHAVEHVPERLTVPGLLWGRRYGLRGSSSRPRYLTLYGLRNADVLDGEPYRDLLRAPTPTSASMRPSFSNVSRWVCDIVDASGMDIADSSTAMPGTELVVDTSFADEAAARSRLAALRGGDSVSAWMLARRRPDATPLPWLDGRQSSGIEGGIEGEWLLCVAMKTESPRPTDAAANVMANADPDPDAVAYRSLRVG